MSVQSEKSFYSYGQNKDETKWQVCLVDIWNDGTVSMIVMAEYHDEDNAKLHASQLETDRQNNA